MPTGSEVPRVPNVNNPFALLVTAIVLVATSVGFRYLSWVTILPFLGFAFIWTIMCVWAIMSASPNLEHSMLLADEILSILFRILNLPVSEVITEKEIFPVVATLAAKISIVLLAIELALARFTTVKISFGYKVKLIAVASFVLFTSFLMALSQPALRELSAFILYLALFAFGIASISVSHTFSKLAAVCATAMPGMGRNL